MTSPRVESVCAIAGYKLRLRFDDGTERIFDAKSYLDRGIFRALQDVEAFRDVRVAYGGVQWADGQSLSPDTLYLRSTPTTSSREESKHTAGS